MIHEHIYKFYTQIRDNEMEKKKDLFWCCFCFLFFFFDNLGLKKKNKVYIN